MVFGDGSQINGGSEVCSRQFTQPVSPNNMEFNQISQRNPFMSNSKTIVSQPSLIQQMQGALIDSAKKVNISKL